LNIIFSSSRFISNNLMSLPVGYKRISQMRIFASTVRWVYTFIPFKQDNQFPFFNYKGRDCAHGQMKKSG